MLLATVYLYHIVKSLLFPFFYLFCYLFNFINDFIYETKYQIKRRASLKKYQEVMDWVISQNIPPDTATCFELPRYFKDVDENGFIEALHTVDGLYCILMKTQLGWRRNFKGTFYCNQSLSTRDFREGFEGVKYICIDGEFDGGFSFRELYVDKQHNSYLYEVYFDLGLYSSV